MKAWQEEMTACQEVTETCLEKAKEWTSVNIESIVVYEEV
jgi:hypothetical protein